MVSAALPLPASSSLRGSLSSPPRAHSLVPLDATVKRGTRRRSGDKSKTVPKATARRHWYIGDRRWSRDRPQTVALRPASDNFWAFWTNGQLGRACSNSNIISRVNRSFTRGVVLRLYTKDALCAIRKNFTSPLIRSNSILESTVFSTIA